MRTLLLLPLLLVSACAQRSLETELAQVRAEIADLEKKVPSDAPLWIREGPNNFDLAVEDRTQRIPGFVYNHLLDKFGKMTEKDVAELVEPSFDLDRLLADPPSCRGKVFAVRGQIARMNAIPIEDGTEPRRFIYSGALFIGNKPVLFHVVSKPDVVYLGQDAVDFKGVFVKTITCPARNGEAVEAPFFICRAVRKYY